VAVLVQRFGEKLALLRKRRGMTLQELADALAYRGTGYLSRVETGKQQPSLELAMKVANLFNVTVDQLVRDDLDVQDLQ
jgi:transcriptional regulator with XRE-family HTH domain